MKIVENVLPNDFIEKLEVAGPGYVNIYLNRSYVKSALSSIFREDVKPAMEKKQRVLVDFSSPNIAKEMHVGHLR